MRHTVKQATAVLAGILACAAISMLFLAMPGYAQAASSPKPSESPRQGAVRTLVAIDYRVPSPELLTRDLPEDTAWLVIYSQRGGLEQLAAASSSYDNLDSIQIIAHGRDGAVTLGSGAVDAQSLTDSAAQLRGIASSLSATGDLLLYACSVALSPVGERFIRDLAQATGADVAASTGLIGATALGGNWLLESSTGPVEAGVAISARSRSAFAGALQTNVMRFSGNTSIKASNAFPRMETDASVEVWFKYDSSTAGTGTLVQGLPNSTAFEGERASFELYLSGGRVGARLTGRFSSYVRSLARLEC